MGEFNLRELLGKAWDSTQTGRERAAEIYDSAQERKIPRRTMLVGIFGTALGSLILKGDNEKTKTTNELYKELLDHFDGNAAELSYSGFLKEIENKTVAKLHVTDDTAIITRRDGTLAKTKFHDSATIPSMIKDRTIDPNAIEIFFDDNPEFKSIDFKGLKKTIRENWEIPTLIATTPHVKKEIESIIAEKTNTQSSQEELENTAYHEASHAVASIVHPGLNKLEYVTIKPDNHNSPKEDNHEHKAVSPSKSILMNEILIGMAGRAAEEYRYGIENYTCGSRSDLEQAYEVATHMVERYGMSDDIGPVVKPRNTTESNGTTLGSAHFSDDVTLSDSSKPGLIHRIFGIDPNPHSEAMKVRIEEAREKILRKGLDDARLFVAQNWDAIDRVAQALLEHKTLKADEIKKLIYQDHSEPDITLG